MPGHIDVWDQGWVRGWARHPTHASFPLTVHAVAAGRVAATTLADIARPDGMAGFELPLDHAILTGRPEILLGETDEVLALPIAPRPVHRPLTVEELIATPSRRAWVTGACEIDAAAAGLLPETIVDLLCRDFLGRPAGPVVTAAALAQLPREGYHGVRRMLIGASEYKYRRIHATDAPGAIFSRGLIMTAAARDFSTDSQRKAKVSEISAAPLLALEAEDFVTACYRRILRKEPDRAGMAHYLGQLDAGISKVSIIRHLSNEFETISAGITIVDLPAEGG